MLKKSSNFDFFTCPLDNKPLVKVDKQWVCPDGHGFDIAKEGYVNLLPVQHKRSKSPGDNKQMVQARKNFLTQGHYQPISQRINELLTPQLTGGAAILDAGCGEGYYLNQLVQHSSEELSAVGLDISKFAVAAAAKQYKQLNWLVASNRQIPIADDSLNAIVCAFGFPVYSEFKQKLNNQGWLLLVETGEHHLNEIKQVIYPEVKPFKPFNLSTAQEHGFELQQQSNLQYQITLTQSQIPDLLAMTPHLYRAPKDGLNKVFALEQITTTVDVDFYLLRVTS